MRSTSRHYSEIQCAVRNEDGFKSPAMAEAELTRRLADVARVEELDPQSVESGKLRCEADKE
jgi:hypothetical protein